MFTERNALCRNFKKKQVTCMHDILDEVWGESSQKQCIRSMMIKVGRKMQCVKREIRPEMLAWNSKGKIELLMLSEDRILSS